MDTSTLTPIIIATGLALLIGLGVGVFIARKRASSAGSPQAETGPTADEAAEALIKIYEDHPAYRAYLQFLISKNIPTREINSRMLEFAEQLESLRQRLSEMKEGAGETAAIADSAEEALNDGDFDRASELFLDLGQREKATGDNFVRRSEKHLQSAATVYVVSGDLHMARLNYAAAKESYQQALSSFPASKQKPAEYFNKLGAAAFHSGDQDLAISAFKHAVDILEAEGKGDNPDLATALNNLGLLHYARKAFEEAEGFYQRALAIDEKLLGDDHVAVATDLNNLALLYKRLKRLDDAEPLFKRSLDIKEKLLPPGHASLTTGMKNYAALLRAMDRGDEASLLDKKASMPMEKRNEAAA